MILLRMNIEYNETELFLFLYILFLNHEDTQS